MAFWDKLRGELIDIIEYTDDSGDTIVHRFERYGNEIKTGAKLTVREGQAAVFVSEGRIADVFEPGMYTLSTSNMPILSTLLGWAHGFESPFKAEVYFVATRRFTDMKWGTKNPIMLRDPEFGPVRLRAFGSYTIRVNKPGTFIKEVVGTESEFTTDEITDQLRNLVVARFSDLLGESKIPVLDLAANYDELGDFSTQRLGTAFGDYGLEVLQLTVENISLPPAVEEALDKRSSMGIIGNMQQYMQYQAAEAIEDAANNEGGGSGLAAGGLGAGLGIAFGQQMANSMGPAQPGASPTGSPPPIPGAAAPAFFVAVNGQQTGPFDMTTLKTQVQAGRVTRETLVWKAGMAQWTAAGSVAELAPLFESVPPPLPPQP
ncbi:MAG: SPFH domain-containing protein [Planctomycetes bacterium]|nr:SPFH domain-containing protein [Planctomycetota bacterium]NOG54234.1 SPFH domain-containing protein [Planctomycetota bacterium]